MVERIGIYAQLACIWEATARKPGNVHPQRSFTDLHYIDFLNSAAAVAPVFDRADSQTVGEIVLSAVQATRLVATTNTNLGIVLLLAPLAKVPHHESIRDGISRILSELSIDDSRFVQQAIQLAEPGGLGVAKKHDARNEPTLPLQDWMRLAQGNDTIALQYVNQFSDVLDYGVTALEDGLRKTSSLEDAIIWTQLAYLSNYGDSLIGRKCGDGVSRAARRKALEVLDAGWPEKLTGHVILQYFDDWLRADGNRRNPGTTADLVTACLFVALRESIITLPLDRPFSNGS